MTTEKCPECGARRGEQCGRSFMPGKCPIGNPTSKQQDVPYHQMPQHIIDKAVEVRRWFDEHGFRNWSAAGIGPRHPVQTEICPVCQTGHDKPLCPVNEAILDAACGKYAGETKAPLVDWQASHAIALEQRDTLARWIVQRRQERRDHACFKCMPEGGDLVKPGFVCAFHLAEEFTSRLAVKTEAPLAQCPYCKRPTGDDGCIVHEGGCAGLENVVLNRLQYDLLVSRGAETKASHERRVVGHASGWQEQMDTCVCGQQWPCPKADIRALFNKGIGVQNRNRFSFSFETEEEANRAFHYIADLGTLETSQPPLKTTVSRESLVYRLLAAFNDPHFDPADFQAMLQEVNRLESPDRWIPVTERIPEPEVFVLCWDGRQTFVEWFGSKPDAGRGVTHWIPYPMPPGATSDMHDGRRAFDVKAEPR